MYPWIAVIGVRISWLMFARNSLFTRLDSMAMRHSASAWAFFSSCASWAAVTRISRSPCSQRKMRNPASNTTQKPCSTVRQMLAYATP